MQKKNDRRETCGAKIPPRAMSLHLRAYTPAAVYTRVYGPSPFLRLRHEFRLIYSFFFSLRATMATTHDGLVRGVISLVSNDFPFSSISRFTFLSILSHYDIIFPSCSSSSSFASSFSSYFSFSFTSFSFSSILHRSGKDPPRVALHERVVDEESVKLALRQHYPAGYRYFGCLVISSRVRSTTV